MQTKIQRNVNKPKTLPTSTFSSVGDLVLILCTVFVVDEPSLRWHLTKPCSWIYFTQFQPPNRVKLSTRKSTQKSIFFLLYCIAFSIAGILLDLAVGELQNFLHPVSIHPGTRTDDHWIASPTVDHRLSRRRLLHFADIDPYTLTDIYSVFTSFANGKLDLTNLVSKMSLGHLGSNPRQLN